MQAHEECLRVQNAQAIGQRPEGAEAPPQEGPLGTLPRIEAQDWQTHRVGTACP